MIPGNVVPHLQSGPKDMTGYLRTGDQVSMSSSATGGNNWTRWDYDSKTDIIKNSEPLSATVSRTKNAGWSSRGSAPYKVAIGAVVEFQVTGGALGTYTFRLTYTGVAVSQTVYDVRRGEIRADGTLFLYGGGSPSSTGYIKIISDGS